MVYYRKLIGEIHKHAAANMTAETRDGVYELLNELKQKNAGFKKAHVQSVKAELGERTKAVKAGICPKCGGELIQRKGKYGLFTGCSNFPKCRFIAK